MEYFRIARKISPKRLLALFQGLATKFELDHLVIKAAGRFDAHLARLKTERTERENSGTASHRKEEREIKPCLKM
jgi:hypothetical protein